MEKPLKKEWRLPGRGEELGVQGEEIWPEHLFTVDTLSLSLHMLLRKTPGGEEERGRHALCLQGKGVFFNLQDRVLLENHFLGAPGSITGEHLGYQVGLEPGAREGMNTHWLPGIIGGCLLCSNPGRSPHTGNKSMVGGIRGQHSGLTYWGEQGMRNPGEPSS